ncbi:MAG: hypothetical protein SGJ11_02750 [Phycisphaerae bacterium]|nr:hypothetical protein [Phycisphaerae bacterium]
MNRVLRRVLLPITIIGIALALSWWGNRDGDDRRAAVTSFVAGVMGGGDAGASLPLIVEAARSRIPAGEAIEVEVRDGDGGPSPHGAASHVAMIRVRGLAALAVRVRYDPDPAQMAIVGWFEPGS